MSKHISIDDVEETIRSKIYVQDYSPKPHIDAVKIVTIKNFVGEEGDFSEVFKLTEDGELDQFPDFKLRQINRTKLFSKSLKAWHVHFRQGEIWYVSPSDHVFVGLWDLRKNSPTKDTTMRIVLGGGNSQLLYIPRGVAHGSVNFLERPVELYYFTDEVFNVNNPDERRINWDALGKGFWLPERD